MIKCFLDTNTLIHYQLFSEIRWPSILETDSVQLVICSTVLSELDRKKFSELDIDLRNRCRTVVSALSDFRKRGQVRENFTLEFWAFEPNVDWNELGLDPTIPDDRIIATILGSDREVPLVLVTSDLGLELKADTRNIRTIKLDDSLRIQIKLDKKDEEIRKLSQKVQNLERGLPRLGLELLSDNGDSTHVRFTPSVPSLIDADEISKILVQENQKLKDIAASVPGARLPSFGKIDTDFRTPGAEELKRYREDSENYLNELRQYYETESKRAYINSRFFCIQLQLTNSGNVPADDIDVFLHFPDGFEMSEDNPYLYSDERPSRPTPPQSALEKMQNIGRNLTGGLFDRSHHDMPDLSRFVAPNVSGASIKRTNSFDVTFHVGRVKHKQKEQLEPLWIYFAKNQSIESFQFSFRLSAANYPDEVTGSLNVVFDAGPA